MASLSGGLDAIEAVVQVGNAETPYRRAGRGAAVLLLSGGAEAERDRVFRWLAGRQLVIEPLTRPRVEEWPTWLPGVVEGLGLERPDLIVTREEVDTVRALTAAHPGWAGGVLLIDSIDV